MDASLLLWSVRIIIEVEKQWHLGWDLFLELLSHQGYIHTMIVKSSFLAAI